MDDSHSWIAVAEIIANKTDWTTVLVGLVAGVIGVAGNYWLWSRQAAAERKSIRASLIAEVGSMLKIIEKRGYLALLERQLQRAILHGRYLTDKDFATDIVVSESYNLVYRTNVSRLGALKAEEALDVVRFHHLMECLNVDMGEGGAIREGSNDPELWSESIEILNEAIAIGENLGSKRPWYKRLWTRSGR